MMSNITQRHGYRQANFDKQLLLRQAEKIGNFPGVSKIHKLINLYQTPFPAGFWPKKRVDTDVSEYGKPMIRYQSQKLRICWGLPNLFPYSYVKQACKIAGSSAHGCGVPADPAGRALGR